MSKSTYTTLEQFATQLAALPNDAQCNLWISRYYQVTFSSATSQTNQLVSPKDAWNCVAVKQNTNSTVGDFLQTLQPAIKINPKASVMLEDSPCHGSMITNCQYTVHVNTVVTPFHATTMNPLMTAEQFCVFINSQTPTPSIEEVKELCKEKTGSNNALYSVDSHWYSVSEVSNAFPHTYEWNSLFKEDDNLLIANVSKEELLRIGTANKIRMNLEHTASCAKDVISTIAGMIPVAPQPVEKELLAPFNDRKNQYRLTECPHCIIEKTSSGLLILVGSTTASDHHTVEAPSDSQKAFVRGMQKGICVLDSY